MAVAAVERSLSRCVGKHPLPFPAGLGIMTSDPLARSIQTLFHLGAMGGLRDGLLLERFAADPSSASEAFRLVVERHAPMVMGVCRRVLGNVHDAEDASQAAFLILARHANSIRAEESVGPWLYRVAYRVALRARKNVHRRRAHEHRKAEMVSKQIASEDPHREASLIDDEIHRLPARLQAPIVMCDLEGMSQDYAASQLGIPLRTLQRRLADARNRLRTRLEHQGITIPTERDPASASLLIAPAAEVAASWVEATAHAAMGFGARKAAASATSTLLANAYLRTKLVAKLSIAASMIVSGAIITAGVVAFAQKPDPTMSPPPEVKHDVEQPPTIKMIVKDAETKTPLKDVALTLIVSGAETRFQTDANGEASLPLPGRSPNHVMIQVQAPGYVPMRMNWYPSPHNEIPSVYPLGLERGTTVGGIIQDEAGLPIAGATVSLTIANQPHPSPAYIDVNDLQVRTDARGAWHCDVLPDMADRVLIKLSHHDYQSDLSYGQTTQPPIEKLRDRSAVMMMREGVTFEGMVIDEQGLPIVGARILQGLPETSAFAETRTDANGRFRFAHVAAGRIVVIAQAPGFAPELKAFNTTIQEDPREFRLKPGKPIVGRVTDSKGTPLAGVKVYADYWQGTRIMDILNLQGASDDQGNFRIDDAPDDVMTLYAYLEGFAAEFHIAAKPGTPVEILLMPALKVRGSVIDAQTRQPIDAFTITPGLVISKDETRWDRGEAKTFARGKYEILFQFPHPTGHVVTVEAKGYLPAVSRTFTFAEEAPTFDFALTRGVAPGLNGLIRLPDGTPVSNIDVHRVSKSEPIEVVNGSVVKTTIRRDSTVPTNRDGSFSFPTRRDPAFVFAAHELGYVLAKASDVVENPVLTLTPWGRIEGVARSGSEVVPNAKVIWIPSGARPDELIAVEFSNQAHTDAEGRFVMDRVPDVRGLITREVRRTGRFLGTTPGLVAHVPPGDTAVVTVGGGGRTLVGELRSAARPPWEIDFDRCAGNLIQTVPQPPVPNDLTPEQQIAWLAEWEKTPEGKAMREIREGRRYYPVRFEPDGSIHVDDVRPGAYELRLSLVAKSENAPKPAFIVQSVVVPEMPEDGGDPGPLDLGTIKIK